ncbi:MAG TPA: Wzz/FepE/Etk N-terminal domain-containing protein, partial [Acidobacteriaceae bacterium]|nr:Wzz/FepE/Etk N-terminal domain-containing protein [Acidobacteriaceae bacterium]
MDLWLVVRKRRVLLVCFALGAAALGFGFGVMRGKEYTATGEIEIQPGSASSLKSITSLFDSELSSLDEIMETDVAILQSPSLLVDVARNLNLLNNKDFVAPGSTVAGPGGTKLPLWNGDLNNPYVRNAVAGELKAGLT